MINSKKLRGDFVKILNDIKLNLNLKQPLKPIVEQIDLLDKNIVQNHETIMNLPKYSKNAVLKIADDNQKLKTFVYRYKIFQQYNMQQEADLELSNLMQFVEQLKNNFSLVKRNNNVDINSRIKDIIEFMKPHVALVGEDCAVRDLQRGLSLLNKNRRKSPIEAKNILKQDGICGHKTIACICDVCRNYPPRIIKRYIKKGIQNNVIFDTKNNKDINSSELINWLCANLESSQERKI